MKEKLGIAGAMAAALLASVCCIGPVVLAVGQLRLALSRG
jgi:hypothetical protein